jgi:WD40 repeat protein
LHTLAGHEGEVNAVAVTVQGDRAVSASYDGTVRVWDLENGKEMAVLRLDGIVTAFACSPDGSALVAGDGAGNVSCLLAEYIR